MKKYLKKIDFAVYYILGYLALWSFLALPYYYTPSDEGYFLTADPLRTHFPFFIFSLRVIRWFFELTPFHPANALVLLNLISGAITLWLLFKWASNQKSYWIIYILFSFSPWMSKYFFWASYAPFATMLLFSSFYLIEKKKKYFLAGVASGLALLSSASAILYVGLLILFNFRKIRRFILGMMWVVLPVFYFWFPIVKDYWWLNIHSPHLSRAFHLYGYIPTVPYLSLLRIGMVDAKILFFLFCLFIFREKRLLLFVFLHAALIDLLPFTKLGRTHYSVYPLIIVIIFLGLHKILEKKPYLALGILMLMLCENSLSIWNMMKSKKMFPEYLTTHPNLQLFGFEEDPHRLDISIWSEREVIPIKNYSEFIVDEHTEKGLLIGPRGVNSGKSVLHDSSIKDYFPLKNSTNLRQIYFPYFSSLPSFLMEEEISQGFYFEGKTQAPNSPDSKILLLYP